MTTNLVPTSILGTVLTRAMAAYPRECCGVLYGRSAVTGVRQLRNAATDPVHHFEVDPAEQLAAWAEIEAAGQLPLIAYHSHTHGTEKLSQNDIDNCDPSMLQLLVCLSDLSNIRIRLYRVVDGDPRTVIAIDI